MRLLREALRDLEVYYYLGYKLKSTLNAHHKILLKIIFIGSGKSDWMVKLILFNDFPDLLKRKG